MLLGFLTILYFFAAIFVILLILIQKGKGGLGLGNLGGTNQFLFGGSGGQDIFQKLTWILGAILIFGSLGLALWKANSTGAGRVFNTQQHDSPRPAK